MTLLSRRTFLLPLALVPVAASLAHADSDDDDDNKQASRAVEQGNALPLADILRKVHAQLGGEVIGLKFKRKDGRYVYKLKIVTPAGQLREVSVDATTAEIIQSKED